MKDLMNIGKMILAEAAALGADVCQCSLSESETKEFNVDGGRFSLMRTLFDRSVSVTVLKEQRKGSVAINRFDEASVRAAVADAVTASESAEPDPAWEICSEPRDEESFQGSPECDTDGLFARTKELMEDIGQRHPKILMEQMITSHSSCRSVYMNSYGVISQSVSGAYSFGMMYSAHEGDKGTSFYGSDVTLGNLARPVIECALIDRELGEIEKQLDPEPLEGKFVGTAVLAPAALGEIVGYTILDNFVSDAALIDGTSIWKDKLGEKIADERMTISFDPDAAGAVIRQYITGEGYPAEPYDLIRDGKLCAFALSQYGANKTGNKRAPYPAANFYIPAGDQTLDEIIGGIDRGVLVMRFSGGAPAPSGEFSGVAKNSFLIEDGKIRCALAETMISGSVPDMVNNIRAVSSDVLKDGSNSVPYVAFDGVTISGK